MHLFKPDILANECYSLADEDTINVYSLREHTFPPDAL